MSGIGVCLREFRLARGLSQEELAFEAGVVSAACGNDAGESAF